VLWDSPKFSDWLKILLRLTRWLYLQLMFTMVKDTEKISRTDIFTEQSPGRSNVGLEFFIRGDVGSAFSLATNYKDTCAMSLRKKSCWSLSVQGFWCAGHISISCYAISHSNWNLRPQKWTWYLTLIFIFVQSNLTNCCGTAHCSSCTWQNHQSLTFKNHIPKVVQMSIIVPGCLEDMQGINNQAVLLTPSSQKVADSQHQLPNR
jgi:hypothetical protein